MVTAPTLAMGALMDVVVIARLRQWRIYKCVCMTASVYARPLVIRLSQYLRRVGKDDCEASPPLGFFTLGLCARHCAYACVRTTGRGIFSSSFDGRWRGDQAGQDMITGVTSPKITTATTMCLAMFLPTL